MAVSGERQPAVAPFLPPLIQVLISGLGLLISLLFGLILFLTGLANLIAGNLASQELLPFFTMAFTSLCIGILLTPSLVGAIRQLSNREAQVRIGRIWRFSLLGLLLWVPLLLAGYWVARTGLVPWLFLPLLGIVLVMVPIAAWLVLSCSRVLDRQDRGWGVFAFGVVITQPTVILVEIILIGALGLAAFLWVWLQPGMADELARLGARLMDAQLDPQLMEGILSPYLRQPGILYLVLAVSAGLIPLLEELLKPLGLWLLARKNLSEAEGFALGAIAGATFALLESLGMLSSATVLDWSGVVMARLGTGILHITTTGLMGWGLAIAWKQARYLSLGVTFLISFSMHAIWNLLGMLVGLAPYIPEASWLRNLAGIAPLALSVLALCMLAILLSGNRRLRRSLPSNSLQPLPDNTLER